MSRTSQQVGTDRVTSAKSRALKATGLMASVATGAFGVAAVAAADAQAGTIHACYKKSNHQLSYSKSGSCKHGSKLISWNSAGPQGAQGATGAQGAQGATGGAGSQGAQGAQGAAGQNGTGPGYYHYTSLGLGSPIGTTPTVVAAMSPLVGGVYDVNGATTVINSGGAHTECWLRNVNSSGSPSASTPQIFETLQNDWIPIANTGMVAGSFDRSVQIQDVCENYAGTGTARYDGAELTGSQVTTATRLSRKARSALHNKIPRHTPPQ